MALTIDQQSHFKHFCKICKKGFLCGRALGGHMRAHGIGDEGGCLDDDDQASDWEDKGRGGGGNALPREKRMYALRTNPNRQRCCRACENCGKEFSSWKSFLEHGKCSSDDAESPVSSPGSDGEDGEKRRPYGSGWSKRKRSFRANVGNFPSNSCCPSEEEELANCLVMLSNANVDSLFMDQPEESCASASKEDHQDRRNPITFITTQIPPNLDDYKAKGVASTNHSKGMFECKACKKVFTSHQALGGHRASHKKVKGCFAARLDLVDQDSFGDEDNRAIANDPDFTRPTKSICTTLQLEHGSSNSPLMAMPKRKSKVHECSICHRVFSSGQALGGHKRCHWITSNAPPDPSSLVRFQQIQDQIEQIQEMPMFNDQSLDLNMPAPHDQNIMGIRREHSNSLSFQVSTDILLQPWGTNGVNIDNSKRNQHHHQQPLQEIEIEEDKNGGPKKSNNNGYDQSNVPNNNKEDEADSKVKLARICEIKDHMSTNGCSSPWLQVGIGSSNPVEANP